MNDFNEGLTYAWEVLTGVFEDKTSKFIRYTCFILLILGMLWAGLTYFQAEHISNLDEEMEDYRPDEADRAQGEAYNRLVDLAKTVGTMRRGGEAIAASMGGVSSMPFNIAGYDEMGLEDLNSPVNPVVRIISDSVPAPVAQKEEKVEEPEPQREPLRIRAVMVSRTDKYAVIDYAQKAGHVIRQGQELPGGTGRVVRITKDGITVRPVGSKKEVNYTVE